MLSDLTIQELELAPNEVREKFEKIPQSSILTVGITDEVIKLAESYINEGALSNKSYNDALHIALSTINLANVLASWNFKHIVNLSAFGFTNQSI